MVKELSKVTNSGNVLLTHVPTITKDKNFLKQTHNKSFYTKDECTDYLSLKSKDQSNLQLFGEDINQNLAKRFFVSNYDLIYTLSSKKIYHLYEYFSENDLLKLHLDIDIKKKQMKQSSINFDNIIDQCITLILEHLKDRKILKPQIIILMSNREDKYSAHIIFKDIVFENIYTMGHFISSINSQLIENKTIDMNIYKKGCFRMLWNSKYGIGKNLEYCRSINYDYSDNKQLFLDCLLKNIGKKYNYVSINMPKNVKIKKYGNNKKSKDNIDLIGNDLKITHHPISEIKKYLDLLSVSRADEYLKWIRVGMCLHNCNPNEDCFNLWNEWSKVSDSYVSRDENAYKWNSFRSGYFSIGTLKYLAKKDNPNTYLDIANSFDKPIFDSLKFNSNYLFSSEDEIIKENKSFISNHILSWLSNKSVKNLSIKSPYNTGKTRLIKKIIEEFNFKRILFISYRQTLTNELHGSFIKLGVNSYLNRNYNEDRLICQIESLHKLLPDNISDENIEIPSYDLVIIDEIESVLSHFRSSTISNKESTFNLMKDIIYNSNKLLVLDGDFHNRSYDFISHFGKTIVLENECKKDKRNYIFTNNKNNFEESIDKDLKDGKNIAIISMSSKMALFYNDKYADSYKTVLHCSKSDDHNKNELKNVNEFWNNFQLVIYSPSVESGTNFDREHFDKIYVILSQKSTSPRGLMQMNNRIRKIKNNDIFVYLNNLPFKEKTNYYCYDEIKEYICEMYNRYFEPKSILDPVTNKMVIKFNFDLYAKILVHNETENANKNKNLFVAYFIKLLLEKGHTYSYTDIKMNFHNKVQNTFSKDDILECGDITSDHLDTLLIKQRNNKATKEEKIMIERYILKKDWKLVTDNENGDGKILDAEFLDKYYGKTHILLNLRSLFGKKEDDNNIDFDYTVKKEQVKMIKDVIFKLGFDKPNDGIKLSKDDFEKAINKVLSESILFIDPNKSQPLFGFDKIRISGIKTIKQFMGFINSLFAEWGITIKVKQHSIKENKKVLKSNFYLLNYLDCFDAYL